MFLLELAAGANASSPESPDHVSMTSRCLEDCGAKVGMWLGGHLTGGLSEPICVRLRPHREAPSNYWFYSSEDSLLMLLDKCPLVGRPQGGLTALKPLKQLEEEQDICDPLIRLLCDHKSCLTNSTGET